MLNALTAHSLPSEEFRTLGLNDVAYIKRVTINGQRGWAAHNADGTPLLAAESKELAAAALRQHDMEPLLAH